jgi:hypothetical protein
VSIIYIHIIKVLWWEWRERHKNLKQWNNSSHITQVYKIFADIVGWVDFEDYLFIYVCSIYLNSAFFKNDV